MALAGKPFRVLEIFSQVRGIKRALADRFPERPVVLVSIDKWVYPGVQREKMPEHMSETFRQCHLEFSDPSVLRRQLGQLLGSLRFDEIHAHVPGTLGVPKSPVGVCLKVLAEYLDPSNPRARLYHLAFDEGDFLGFPLGRGSGVDCYRENLSQIQAAASHAGLRVEKYGMSERGGWRTSERKLHTDVSSDVICRAIARHSQYGHAAPNFVIFRRAGEFQECP